MYYIYIYICVHIYIYIYVMQATRKRLGAPRERRCYGVFSRFQFARMRFEGLKSHIQIHGIVCDTIANPIFVYQEMHACKNSNP